MKPIEQNEKTLSFWDDFYHPADGKNTGHDNNGVVTEWILHPSLSLYEKLYEKLPPPAKPTAAATTKTTANNNNKNNTFVQLVQILEIGCGTSTLARSFWLYCRDVKGRPDVSICATDVSDICIQQNRRRDRDWVLLDDESRCSSGQKKQQQAVGCLEYATFNVAERPQLRQQQNNRDNTTTISSNSQFDMIIDKGCLDTFSFRSRQRGDQRDSLVDRALVNIHSLLKDHQLSVYVIISPRVKFKSVRDFTGFERVERSVLNETELGGTITKGKIYCQENKVPDHTTKKRGNFYMYSCYKKIGQSSNDSPLAVKASSPPPSDTDRCSKCNISFLDYRNGEDPQGKGMKYWQRNFRGHCLHCKGSIL